MRTWRAGVAVVFGFSLACAGGEAPPAAPVPEAAPAAAAAPADDPTAAGALKFAFSTWRLEWIGDSANNELTFLPDGTCPDKKFPNDTNTYTVDGKKIHIEQNSGFVHYDGEFVDPLTMGGTYKTEGGDKGAWKAMRIE